MTFTEARWPARRQLRRVYNRCTAAADVSPKGHLSAAILASP